MASQSREKLRRAIRLLKHPGLRNLGAVVSPKIRLRRTDRVIEILRGILMTHQSLSISLLGLIVALGIGTVPPSIASAAEAGSGEGLVVFNRKSAMKGKAIRFNIQRQGPR